MPNHWEQLALLLHVAGAPLEWGKTIHITAKPLEERRTSRVLSARLVSGAARGVVQE